ncbi:MAG: hypothetical protein K6F33_15500 [Bacteroidales bacterium]|nr:hypothetical protein [Bacteroidales bacterium]
MTTKRKKIIASVISVLIGIILMCTVHVFGGIPFILFAIIIWFSKGNKGGKNSGSDDFHNPPFDHDYYINHVWNNQ